MSEFDAMLAKIGHQRGPTQGWGNNGRGKPFAGIVEDTTSFWVGWLVDAARAAGIEPQSVRVAFCNVPLTITPVKVGFGTRYYWRCPECDRRCEAVFWARRHNSIVAVSSTFFDPSLTPSGISAVEAMLDKLFISIVIS